MKKAVPRAILVLALFFVGAFSSASQTNALFQQGLDEFNRKEYSKSIDTYKQYLTQFPNDYSAHFNVGLAYYNLFNYPLAEGSLRSAIRIKPDYVRAHVYLGSTLSFANRYNEAIAELMKALEFEPNNSGAYFEIGLAHYRQKNYTAALQ